MEYQDLGRRDYVNRRLRVKGRFVSRQKAVELLFGPDHEKEATSYSFEELKILIKRKFGPKMKS